MGELQSVAVGRGQLQNIHIRRWLNGAYRLSRLYAKSSPSKLTFYGN